MGLFVPFQRSSGLSQTPWTFLQIQMVNPLILTLHPSQVNVERATLLYHSGSEAWSCQQILWRHLRIEPGMLEYRYLANPGQNTPSHTTGTESWRRNCDSNLPRAKAAGTCDTLLVQTTSIAHISFCLLLTSKRSKKWLQSRSTKRVSPSPYIEIISGCFGAACSTSKRQYPSLWIASPAPARATS